METCFGWLRGTTRGFTSSQSNFGAAVPDGRAAARGGLGRGARAAGCRGSPGGPRAWGEERAAGRARGGRKRGPAGRGGQVRAWAGRAGGRVSAGSPGAGRRGGRASGAAREVWEWGHRVPGGRKCAGPRGVGRGSLALLPLAAHRLGGGPRTFLRLAVSPGAVAAGAEGRSRGPWRRREEGCPRRGRGAGRKGGCGRDAGREPLGWVVGDTGGNFGGSREDAGEPGCHGRGTLRSRLVGCYSCVLVTAIWLLLK